MTIFPYETKQNGSIHKYKYYCYSEASTVHVNQQIIYSKCIHKGKP